MSNIPIVLLSHNRLSTLEKLCDQLALLDYDNIVILDLGSSYKPLLQWYKQCPYDVIMADNIGHKGLWTAGYIKQFENWPYIAVSDSDIELNMNTPNSFIEDMIQVARDYDIEKVGLAIEYKDITNPVYKKIITPIEENYWVGQLQDSRELYVAPVDTSFCVVRTDLPFQYNAIRIAGNYTCRHIPWYSDFDNLSEEEQYYMNTADPRIATCVTHYNNYKESRLING